VKSCWEQAVLISWDEIVVHGMYGKSCWEQAVIIVDILKRDRLGRRRRSGTELRDHFLVFAIEFLCDWFDCSLT
jgi:hypothetical protein